MEVFRVELHGGKEFRCAVCGVGTRFNRYEAALGPGPGGFLFADLQGITVEAAVCTGCGYVHLFEYRRVTWTSE